MADVVSSLSPKASQNEYIVYKMYFFYASGWSKLIVVIWTCLLNIRVCVLINRGLVITDLYIIDENDTKGGEA